MLAPAGRLAEILRGQLQVAAALRTGDRFAHDRSRNPAEETQWNSKDFAARLEKTQADSR